jgi:hypothetical protein
MDMHTALLLPVLMENWLHGRWAQARLGVEDTIQLNAKTIQYTMWHSLIHLTSFASSTSVVLEY